ncbi:MAG: hypothetical protein ACYCW6_24185 [Candidatus Xenobia bacterium]
MKEKRGVKILKDDGTAFQHLDENRGARKAVVNQLNELRSRIAKLWNGNGPEPALLAEKAADLQKMLDQIPVRP